MKWLANVAAVALLCLPLPAALAQSVSEATLPAPQFTPGLVLSYRLDIRTTHDATVTGVVEDPQGGTRLSVRFGAVLKLEALAPGAAGTQVRATVEQVSVVIDGDTFDPSIASPERGYRQLEGFTTTLTPSPGPRPAAPDSAEPVVTVEHWLRALVSRISVGGAGNSSGKATSEQPIAASPLRGTVLRAESTYLRDEPCGGQAERVATNAASLAAEACAVVLTHSTLTQSGSRRDQTPQNYRERGLRTSGRWEGAGESLAYVARRTGWVVSITESQSEQMDFIITRTDGEVVRRQRGRIETQTNLLLQSVASKE